MKITYLEVIKFSETQSGITFQYKLILINQYDKTILICIFDVLIQY